MKFDITKKVSFQNSFRNQSIIGMFDLQDENYTEKFSGSIDLVGPLNIRDSINQTALSIHIEDANGPDEKFQVNGQGIPVLAPLTFPPTPVSGGMYYSINNEFFLGFT